MKKTSMHKNDIEIEPYDLPGLPSFSLKKGFEIQWDLNLGGSSSCYNLNFIVPNQKISMASAWMDNDEGDSEDIYVDIDLNNIEVYNDDNLTPLMGSDIAPKRIEMEIENVMKEGGSLDTYLLSTKWVKVYF